MKTVQEVSRLAHVSVRTLHYYDSIGLLKPTQVSEAGYRLYDEQALGRLQLILLFRELKFPLKKIAEIVNGPDEQRNRALKEQIERLKKQQEHTGNLIVLAQGILVRGIKNLDFADMDFNRLDEYSQQAKMTWGKTEAWKEYEQKLSQSTPQQQNQAAEDMMKLFERLGALRGQEPSGEAVQQVVGQLRQHITRNFYNCTLPIFSALGRMYGGGGAMSEQIDLRGGRGTAELAARAIEIYCVRQGDLET